MRPLDEAELDALLAEPELELIQRSPRGPVFRVPWAEGHAALKLDEPTSLRSRLGRALRGSRAARAAETARGLLQRGILAPRPLALYEGAARAALVSEWIEGPTLQAALVPGADLSVLGGHLAELLAALHEQGVRARDVKPPNLVVSPAGLVLVDLDDVRFARRVPARLCLRNLAALDAYGQLAAAPPGARARRACLAAYAERRGLALNDLLRAVLPPARAKRARLRARLAR